MFKEKKAEPLVCRMSEELAEEAEINKTLLRKIIGLVNELTAEGVSHAQLWGFDTIVEVVYHLVKYSASPSGNARTSPGN